MTNYRSFMPMQSVDEVLDIYQTYGDIVINRLAYSVEEFMETIQRQELIVLKAEEKRGASSMEVRARREYLHYLYSVQFALGV
ncbi:hypothetical protein [Veillonella caviae]|uniref:hypothetical protein n=1 Tax=Veillonella caviae TaxID=248316 RepID=UPI000F8C66E0|nr:hypothetical protein [Veillonella caviae]